MTTRIIRGIDFDPDFQPGSFDSPGDSLRFFPVIEHEVLSGVEKGREILARARSEASSLRKRSREVLAQAVVEKEEERKRGYAEGVQQGLGELTEKLAEAERGREVILTGAEPEILGMVMEIAEKVIGREVKKGAIVDIVKKTVAQAVGEKVVVRIHPSDLAVVQEKEPELLEAIGKVRSMTVKEDESIAPGGCIVETELGTVDARLETQLGAIRKALGI